MILDKGARADLRRLFLPCRRARRRRPGGSGLPGLRSARPDRESLVGRSGQRQDAGRWRRRLAGCAVELAARRPLGSRASAPATPARCCRASPTSTSSTASAFTSRTSSAARRPARRHDHADERQLRRHRHRRLLCSRSSTPSFVTVEAAPGQTPVFSTLYIRSTNKWVFNGIKVQSLLGTNNNKLSLVTVADQGAALPTSDIILENMQISSADSTDGWTKAQWVAQGAHRLPGGGFAQATARTASQHDLHLDDRIAHPERALRRGADGATTLLFSRQRDRPFRRRRHRLRREQYRDHATTTSTTTWTSATATTRTPCKA